MAHFLRPISQEILRKELKPLMIKRTKPFSKSLLLSIKIT